MTDITVGILFFINDILIILIFQVKVFNNNNPVLLFYNYSIELLNKGGEC